MTISYQNRPVPQTNMVAGRAMIGLTAVGNGAAEAAHDTPDHKKRALTGSVGRGQRLHRQGDQSLVWILPDATLYNVHRLNRQGGCTSVLFAAMMFIGASADDARKGLDEALVTASTYNQKMFDCVWEKAKPLLTTDETAREVAKAGVHDCHDLTVKYQSDLYTVYERQFGYDYASKEAERLSRDHEDRVLEEYVVHIMKTRANLRQTHPNLFH